MWSFLLARLIWTDQPLKRGRKYSCVSWKGDSSAVHRIHFNRWQCSQDIYPGTKSCILSSVFFFMTWFIWQAASWNKIPPWNAEIRGKNNKKKLVCKDMFVSELNPSVKVKSKMSKHAAERQVWRNICSSWSCGVCWELGISCSKQTGRIQTEAAP